MGATETADKRPGRPGAWRRAADLARATPESRNRYVDFLRALSIAAVVIGHWLIAAPHLLEGELVAGHMLGIQPWTRWLTWGFQVMPIFFLVGGYSNAASWAAAQRSGLGYSAWLTARLRRLIGPVLPLLALWSAIAVGGDTSEPKERRRSRLPGWIRLLTRCCFTCPTTGS